jgi:hypothetical protein
MKIHLKSKQGLYEVETYGRNSITCSTKHSVFSVPTSDFKSFAGGSWNHDLTKDDMDLFLSVIDPINYKIQVEQENEIISLAARIDMIDKATKASFTSTVVEEEEEAGPTKEDYERWYDQKSDELNKLRNHMRTIAHEVYSQNLDFTNFQITKGIKFIIQQGNYDHNAFRLCWDPYGFVSNGHSDISSIFRPDDWHTINGGWIKIIEDDVILYFKSGDYGVYDDAIATECAKKLFPGKNIHSFAGRRWDEELDSMFYELPF